MRVGVLSDTHGLLRPEVLERLAGCARILHAGDVGDPAILAALGAIAPTVAVRGNVDRPSPGSGPGDLLGALPATVSGELGEVPFHMVHRREDVPAAWTRGPGPGLVVFGHSHRPELEWRDGVLLLNPGACGPRRFHLPLTVAILTVRERRLVPEILAVE